LFSDAFIQALCWTLIHSLWQGLALAIIAGLYSCWPKKQVLFSVINLLTGLLSLFLVCVTITFYFEFAHHAPAVANQNEVQFVSGNVNIQHTVAGDLPTKGTDYKALVVSFLNNNASLIVFAWILIIVFKCSRLITDLRYIYVLRRRLIYDAGENWDNRLKQLAHKLSISKPSEVVTIRARKNAVVIGHLKPVILLPVAYSPPSLRMKSKLCCCMSWPISAARTLWSICYRISAKSYSFLIRQFSGFRGSSKRNVKTAVMILPSMKWKTKSNWSMPWSHSRNLTTLLHNMLLDLPGRKCTSSTGSKGSSRITIKHWIIWKEPCWPRAL